MSEIKGVYITIDGNITPLQSAMTQASSIVKQAAGDIGTSLNGALNSKQINAGLNSLVSNLQKLNGASKLSGDSFKSLGIDLKELQGMTGLTDAQFKTLQQRMLQTSAQKSAEKAFQALQKQTGLTSKELAALGVRVPESAKAMEDGKASADTFGGSLASLRGIIGTIVFSYLTSQITDFVMSADEASRTVQRLSSAFTYIAGDVQAGGKELAWVRLVADDLGISFYDAAEAYKGISAAAKTTSIASEDVRTVFLGVSQAATTLGLSSEDTKGALLALSQMISKGKVSAEELRQQLGERLPGAFSIAAQSMGMTESEFSKMLETGNVLAKDFIPSFGKAMVAAFGESSQKASEAQKAVERLGTAWTDLSAALGDEVSPGMSHVRKELAGVLGEITAAVKGNGDLADAWERLTSGFNGNAKSLSDARQQLENIENEIKEVRGAMELGQSATFAQLFFPNADKERLGELLDLQAKLKAKIDELSGKQKELASTTKESSEKYKELSASIKEFNETASKAMSYILGMGDDLKELQAKIDNIGDPFADFNVKMSKGFQDRYIEIIAKMPEEVQKSASASAEYLIKAEQLATASIELDKREHGKKLSDIAQDTQNKIDLIGKEGTDAAILRLNQEVEAMRQAGVSELQIRTFYAKSVEELNKNINEDEDKQRQNFFNLLRDGYNKDKEDFIKAAKEKAQANLEYYSEVAKLSGDTVGQLKLDALDYFTKWTDKLSDAQKAYELTMLYIKDKTKTELEKTLEHWGNYNEQVGQGINDLANDTRDALADSISGSLKGEFDSGLDALQSFKEAFLDSVADLVSKALAQFALLTALDWTGLGSLLGGLGKTSTGGLDLSTLLSGYSALKGVGNSGEYLAALMDAVGSGASYKEAAEFASLSTQGTSTSILGSIGTGIKSVVTSISDGIGSLFSSSMAGADAASSMGEAMGMIGQTTEAIEGAATAATSLSSSMLAVTGGAAAVIAIGGTIASMLNASQDTSPEEALATIAESADEIDRLSEVMRTNAEAAGMFDGEIADLVDTMYMMADRAGVSRDYIDELVASLDPLAQGAANVGANMADVNKAVADATQTIQQNSESVWGMTTGIADLADSLFAFADGLGLSDEMSLVLQSSIMNLIADFQQGQITISEFSAYLDDYFKSALDGSLEGVDALADAINGLEDKTVTIDTVYTYTGEGPVSPGEGAGVAYSSALSSLVSYGHTGGLVTPQGIGDNPVLKFHTGGEVPAMLLSGEGVLNRQAMSNIGSSGLKALNNGESIGGDNYVQITIVTPDNSVLEQRVAKLQKGSRPAQMQINLNRRSGAASAPARMPR